MGKYQGQNELGQEVFKDQPLSVDWAGVDYDGELNFGRAINPRYTWASEVWRGYEPIGETVENSGYKPLTQIRRERTYTQTEVERLLETQRGNCYVAVLNETKNTDLASLAGGAPEPWNWKN